MKKIILILVAALVACVLSGCGNSTSLRQEAYDELSYLTEELHSLSVYTEESMHYGYEDLKISLYHLQEECQRLSDEADALSRKFYTPDPEENRRSWFY